MLEVQIRYYPSSSYFVSQPRNGEWVDIPLQDDISLKAGESALIPLGFYAKLPRGHEAILAARSSTFLKYGLMLANGIGIIDNEYFGPKDEWKALVYATRDTENILAGSRLFQFRIQPQNQVYIKEAIVIKDNTLSRGGFGSTGI